MLKFSNFFSLNEANEYTSSFILERTGSISNYKLINKNDLIVLKGEINTGLTALNDSKSIVVIPNTINFNENFNIFLKEAKNPKPDPKSKPDSNSDSKSDSDISNLNFIENKIIYLIYLLYKGVSKTTEFALNSIKKLTSSEKKEVEELAKELEKKESLFKQLKSTLNVVGENIKKNKGLSVLVLLAFISGISNISTDDDYIKIQKTLNSINTGGVSIINTSERFYVGNFEQSSVVDNILIMAPQEWNGIGSVDGKWYPADDLIITLLESNKLQISDANKIKLSNNVSSVVKERVKQKFDLSEHVSLYDLSMIFG